MGQIDIRPEEPMRGIALWLVWGLGDLEDLDSGIAGPHSFLPRPNESLARNARAFSRL